MIIQLLSVGVVSILHGFIGAIRLTRFMWCVFGVRLICMCRLLLTHGFGRLFSRSRDPSG